MGTTGVTATSTPSAIISQTMSASDRMTMSAEICLILDHLDTSVSANLEAPCLTWMNVATTLQLPCLVLETFGLDIVATSMKTQLSTLSIFPVGVIVRRFAKTMKGASSSATQWITRVTMGNVGFITTATTGLITSARTA